jgi:hypothetical protein
VVYLPLVCFIFLVYILFFYDIFLWISENLNNVWILGYWISPLMYAQNAISTNEFTSKSWSKVLRTICKPVFFNVIEEASLTHTVFHLQIIAGSTESMGKSILKSRGLFTEVKWYWIGVGGLVGHTFLFNRLYTIILTYIKCM